MTDRDYNDDYDRPRTRRLRSRAKKKSGHNWWVVPAILGTVGLLFLGCLGVIGFGLWSSGVLGANWREFEPPNGGCRIEMPAEPTLEPQEPGNPSIVYATEQYLPFQSFAIAYVDIPAHETDPSRAFNDGIAGMLTTIPGTKEKSRTTETIAGYPARQVIAYHPNHGGMIGRLIAVEGRMFILVAIGRDFSLEHPAVKRFFDSFTVTNPDPLGRKASREQAEAAAKAEKERKETELRAQEERQRRDYIEQFEVLHPLGRVVPEAMAGSASSLPFDEMPDGAIRDLGAKTVAGTIKAPARFGLGVRGSGLHLPKEDAEVVLPGFAGPAVGPTKPVTIAGWFRVRSMKGNVLQLSLGTGQRKDSMQSTGLVLSSQYASFIWPSRDRLVSLVGPLPEDKSWHHFAVVRTPRTKDEVLDFYLDGQRVARNEPGSQSDLTEFNTMTLGGGGFVGAIDEVAVYHRALIENEMRSLAALSPVSPTGADAAGDPATIPGLVFHLPLDEPGGPAVFEAVSGKPVGKVLGRAEETDGVRGNAVRFLNPTSGNQPVMLDLVDQKEKVRFAKGKPFTVAFWARPTSGTATILGGELALMAFPKQTSGSDQFHLTAFIGSFNRPMGTGLRSADNKWSHVAITRDTSGELVLYVNGVSARGDRLPFATEISPIGPGLLHGLYPCDLDDFCVFDRALSENDVKKLAGRK